MIQKLKLEEFNKRLERLPLATKQKLIVKDPVEVADNLHVVYVMSHVGVSGGVKIIFEHVNRLKKLGVQVSIVSHFEKPTWYPIEANYIQVPFDMELAKGIPDCQVIVATYWDHIQACVETGIAPVVYFEQGDFHLFEYNRMNTTLKNFIKKQFELPEFIYTVSNSTAQCIDEVYKRQAKVIHNAVDETMFSEQVVKFNASNPYLLMVGAESAKFKGIPDIIQAYQFIKSTNINLDLFWITPEEPSEEMKNKVTKYFVQPSQETIAQLYRGASVYVSASNYESFSLPPLEAMACGCPVVTTKNKGVMEYALDEENALLCTIGDPSDLATKIKLLLLNGELRRKLINNGLQTAKKFNWNTITEELRHYYREIASYAVDSTFNRNEWEITVDEHMFLNKKDHRKFIKVLGFTTADLVQVPVVYHLDNAIQIARWEVVANRKKSMKTKVERVFSPMAPANRLALLNQNAYLYFYKKEYELALEEFENIFNRKEDSLEKVTYFRWVLLCLFRLQRKYEAKNKLKDFLDQHEHQNVSELDFLKLLLAKEDFPDAYERISILGDTTTCLEFLFNIKGQINNFIKMH